MRTPVPVLVYVCVQFFGVLAGVTAPVLTGAPEAEIGASLAWAAASLVVFDGLLEGRKPAAWAEAGRLAVTVALVAAALVAR